jgi:hypothetical protein
VVVRNAQQRPVSAQCSEGGEPVAPGHLVLPRNLGPVDVPLVSEEEWFRRIQYEPYGNEQDMAVWRVRAEVLATTLDADTLLTRPTWQTGPPAPTALPLPRATAAARPSPPCATSCCTAPPQKPAGAVLLLGKGPAG